MKFSIKLHESQQRIIYPQLKNAVCVVDGTEPQVPRPYSSELETVYYYSGKKNATVSM
jgi:hypothetical protein